MAEVRAVAYGRAATRALTEVLRDLQAGDPLTPVTVVVPTNAAGLSARRALGAAGGVANVAFVTPFALAERLGRPGLAASGLSRITEPVLLAAIRTELAAAPGFFEPVAGHAATEAALARRYAELSRARPGTLERLRRAGSTRAQALVDLFERVRARLAAFADEDALATHARTVVDEGGSAAATLGAVVVHLPQPVSPALGDLLASVGRARASTWIVGLTGDAEADEPVRTACRRLGVVVTDAPVVAAVATGTEMISASDVDDEVRAVVRRVLELATDGVALDRMAVLVPSVEPYARTLDQQLTAAGIAHNGPPVRRLADTVAGRTLGRLVRMIESTFARDDVVAFLASAPIRRPDGRPAPVDRWDLVSRRAGVVDGDDWDRRLERYAIDVAARERDRAGAAEDRRPAEGAGRSARELAEFVAGLRAHLADLGAAPGWRARAERARSALVDRLGDPGDQAQWPDEEVDAFERTLAALDRLAGLDAVEPRSTASAFARAVESELDVPFGRVGHFGDGVLCAPIGAAAGLDVDAVVVAGLAEGIVPRPRGEDALLSDRDRALAVEDELPVRDAALVEQRRAFLMALAAGDGHRVVSAPRGDLRTGRERLPSRYLLETASARAGRRIFASDVGALGAAEDLDAVPSFAVGVQRIEAAPSSAERELGVIGAFVAAGGDATRHPLVEGSAAAVGIDAVRARDSTAFTRWDGNVGAVRAIVRAPATGDVVSATRLQDWAECPFRYLLANVLGVPVAPTPERLLELSPLDRGSLVHEVLERFVAEELARPVAARTPVGSPWPASAAARLRELMDEAAADAEARGLTGKAALWAAHREEIDDDLQAFLAADGERREKEQVVPLRVEMPFGMDGAPPLTVPLGEGRCVSFRGRADRVDVRPDGTAVVLDYKTGRAYTHVGDDPVAEGRRLQLPVYAAAARALLDADRVEAAYWFVSARGGFEMDRFALDDESDARFREVVGTIVDGIDAGVFPAEPGPPNAFFGSFEHCRYCDYDAVCPVDRDSQAEAKAEDPAAAAFAALVWTGEPA